MSKSPDELKRQSDHIWHVWINRYATAEREAKREWPRSLYEFKSLLNFLEWGCAKIRDAFTGNLPKAHRQCSMSLSEPINANRLICCLGVDVTACSILTDLKATFETERQRECGKLGKFYDQVPDEEMYRRMAQTCAWHIYKEACAVNDSAPFRIDTSEGHLMDVGDRMFWDRVYESMSATDEEHSGERRTEADSRTGSVVANKEGDYKGKQ